MKKVIFNFSSLIFLLFMLCSCGEEQSSLSAVRDISSAFSFKYGMVYSDEFGVDDEKYFSDEMKLIVFGENAGKFDYIVSVSGYFSRDGVSGEEVIVVLLDDRSHSEEITYVLYRRAAKKQDVPTSIFCLGDFVYFVSASNAEQIMEYIKTKM